MVLDPFNVLLLRLGAETEQGKKTRQGFVAVLDATRYFAALVREYEAAILFVLQEAQVAELLHHARDGSLLHVERRCDVHDASIALLLNQLVDSLQIIFGALAG